MVKGKQVIYIKKHFVGGGIPYCMGSYSFTGAGRARCIGETDGFVRLIDHSNTDRILGLHILLPRAADMIAECVLAMASGARSEDIARTIHGQPTFARCCRRRRWVLESAQFVVRVETGGGRHILRFQGLAVKVYYGSQFNRYVNACVDSISSLK